MPEIQVEFCVLPCMALPRDSLRRSLRVGRDNYLISQGKSCSALFKALWLQVTEKHETDIQKKAGRGMKGNILECSGEELR